MGTPQDANLRALLGFPFPAFCSPDNEAQAEAVARRIVRAEAFLSVALGRSPAFTLKVLNSDHWAEHTEVRPYGMPHAINGVLVVGTEPASFWAELGDLFAPLSPPDRQRLAEIYGDPPSFAQFADFIAVHELGHLYHPKAQVHFPRLWLKEFFANLCMYAYAAAEEPEALPLVSVAPRLLAGLPAAVQHTSLADFEQLYSGVGPANYSWYQFGLTALAEELYNAAGPPALPAVAQRFEHTRDEMSDGELMKVLATIHPVLAAGISTWPGQVGSTGATTRSGASTGP